MTSSRFAAAGGALLVALLGTSTVADVISDWNTAVAPPPPELKEVTVDPLTTALLFLDIMKGNCTARPRCVAAMPNLKRLHDEARAHNMVVWYSLVGSNGKATPDDIMDPAIKPRAASSDSVVLIVGLSISESTPRHQILSAACAQGATPTENRTASAGKMSRSRPLTR